MNQAEGQKEWGWLIVLYVFLAGLGGGTFLFSFILIFLDKYTAVARIGALVGPLLVSLGSGMLLFDLGSAMRAYRLFTTPATLLSSWMIRGAWILTAFIILGLAYALPSFSLFSWLPWNQASGFGLGLGIAAALLAIVVARLSRIASRRDKKHSALEHLRLAAALFVGSGYRFSCRSCSCRWHSRPLWVRTVFTCLGLSMQASSSCCWSLWALISDSPPDGSNRGRIRSPACNSAFHRRGNTIGNAATACHLYLRYLSCLMRPSIRLLDGVASLLILGGGLLLRLSVIKSGVRIVVR